VLTGGSAATFYAPHAYQSDDLDFVITLRGNGDGARADLVRTREGFAKVRHLRSAPGCLVMARCLRSAVLDKNKS